MSVRDVEVAIIGAGIAGIATAYFLALHHGVRALALIDPRQAMSLTSAQSGENYRNWWPHATMAAFTNRSIDLMERIAEESENRLHMTRRGYALATRQSCIDSLAAELHAGYGADADKLIRVHEKGSPQSYQPAHSADWHGAPEGVDVVRDRDLIRTSFPSFDSDVATVIHIRRAGDISAQQMGQFMLERIRAAGGSRVPGRVRAVEHAGGFILELATDDGPAKLRAEAVVNAAGPFVKEVGAMLGVELPITNVLQQKIAFEDHANAIDRAMPFAIDLDPQTLDWTPEERALLAEEEALAWLLAPMAGGIHCRPDGGDQGRWIKLGWAYNEAAEAPLWEPELNPQFPEIVIRGAAVLNPSLKAYYGRVPRQFAHYGGYYTMTEENWPLIGPMGPDGAFVVGALSGFGTMSACAAGELGAAWVAGACLPGYGRDLGLARYGDDALMRELKDAANRGVL
ncbi:MAG: FAD-dependent oxidoreductase [Pseudomonadota bacterium]